MEASIAVISLSLQVIQSINTVRVFIRDVKKAPDELMRLVNTFDNLSVLLQDTHEVLKIQISGAKARIPPPSTSIFKSLTSCYDLIRPLKMLIDHYQNRHPGESSKSPKFWDKVRLGMKVKDIQDLEAGIQREIVKLNTALALNNTRIQLQFLPLLVASQNAATESPQCAASSLRSEFLEVARFMSNNIHTEPRVADCTSVQRTSWTRFPFGLRTCTRMHTLHEASEAIQDNKISQCLVQDVVYSWRSPLLGFGIEWTQHKPYGSILPVLTTYPVVRDFSHDFIHTIAQGEVLDIQKAFNYRLVHPFTRDRAGRTALHVAAQACRADVCQLLITIGVRASEPIFDLPTGMFEYLAVCMQHEQGAQKQIDTFRHVLQHVVCQDELNSDVWDILKRDMMLNVGTIEWLWDNLPNYLQHLDTFSFHETCLRECLRQQEVSYFAKFCSPAILRHIQLCSMDLLEELFAGSSDPSSSWALGKAWLNVLESYGVDIQRYITNELAHYPNNLLSQGNRKLIVEFTADFGWTLGWRWYHFDCKDSTCVVFAALSDWTYCVLTEDFGHNDPNQDWPYASQKLSSRNEDNIKTRFDRRMAKKARKHAKQSSQNRIPNKMPGTWID